jgi:hypothetical protein
MAPPQVALGLRPDGEEAGPVVEQEAGSEEVVDDPGGASSGLSPQDEGLTKPFLRDQGIQRKMIIEARG